MYGCDQISRHPLLSPQPEGYSDTKMEDLKAESVLYKGPVDPANWVGLTKSKPLLEYLRVSRASQHHCSYSEGKMHAMHDKIKSEIKKSLNGKKNIKCMGIVHQNTKYIFYIVD